MRARTVQCRKQENGNKEQNLRHDQTEALPNLAKRCGPTVPCGQHFICPLLPVRTRTLAARTADPTDTAQPTRFLLPPSRRKGSGPQWGVGPSGDIPDSFKRSHSNGNSPSESASQPRAPRIGKPTCGGPAKRKSPSVPPRNSGAAFALVWASGSTKALPNCHPLVAVEAQQLNLVSAVRNKKSRAKLADFQKGFCSPDRAAQDVCAAAATA